MDDQLNKIKSFFDSLTNEQKEKASRCKSPEELMTVLGGDTELPDEMLDMVSGGLNIFEAYKKSGMLDLIKMCQDILQGKTDGFTDNNPAEYQEEQQTTDDQ